MKRGVPIPVEVEEGLKVCVCLSVCVCYLSVCLSERSLNKLLCFIVITSVCPQYTVYGIVCHISHLCVHVYDIVTMWLKERFSSVLQDFHIIDDCPKQSLQE